MAIKKIHRTEKEKIKNTIKTDSSKMKEDHTMLPHTGTSPEDHPFPSRMISLQSIVTSISGGEEFWPKEFCDAVKKRTGRIPRIGWVKGVVYFVKIKPPAFLTHGFK